jgi:hypothetical protein
LMLKTGYILKGAAEKAAPFCQIAKMQTKL